jgi:hypothetical protein
MDISVGRLMRYGIFLAVLLALPGPLGAQAGPDPPYPDRVSATAAILLKGGQIAGESRLHLGGWAGLVFRDDLAIGGGGYALLKTVELAGPVGSIGFNLGFGYGGLFFRYWEPFSGPLTGELGLLLGAGHAEVRDILTGTEVGSDNFFVAEPEVSLFYALFPGVHAGVSFGYRLTAGVEGLPRVSASDINTFTGTLSLRLGGD